MNLCLIERDAIKELLGSYLNLNKIQRYTIHLDGVVDIIGDVEIDGRTLTSLPVQFGHVTGRFNCSHNKITSLKGFPYFVGGDLICHSNKITSLSGIHKSIKHIGNRFLCDNESSANIKVTNILGLTLINGLRQVYIDLESGDMILNKHLQGDRDVILCQSELIDAGFIEQAKL